MCYNVVSATRKMIVYATHRGESEEQIAELNKRLEEYSKNVRKHYFVNGFAHPTLFGFTNEKPLEPVLFQWGLVPDWVRDEENAKKMQKSTLNARIETIQEKASFKKAIVHNRCLVYIDGFYEYHHLNGKTFPFLVTRSDEQPMIVAGIFTETEFTESKLSVSFVTTKANEAMSIIHNNPKLEFGPRMPILIEKEDEAIWLDIQMPIKGLLEKFTTPCSSSKLKYTPVAQLTGKVGVGDTEQALEEKHYIELETLLTMLN
jgi:putative SOS response-associated peptidase YedK